MKNLIYFLLLTSVATFGQGSLTLTPNSNSSFIINTYSKDPLILARRSSASAGPAFGATLNARKLAIFGGGGDNGTAFTDVKVAMRFETTENWSAIGNGTKITFSATPNGTIFPADYMVINHDGNVGIGTAAPAEQLDVNGTSKIGVNGTTITEIIKVTRTANIASTPAGTESTFTFQIPNVQLGSTVYISPSINLPDGLIIAHALCEVANAVEVKFFNASSIAVDPPLMNFYITVIR